MGGVQKELISNGTGPAVQKGQTINVHCTGYLELPGQPLKKFWSTHDTSTPFSFQCGLGKVIRGWDEGCLQMRVGETSRLHITSDWGYGERGFPAWGIVPNAPLCFEIQILSAQ